MSQNKLALRASQIGAFTVEFALLSMIFLTVLFAVLEVARVVYLFNTLQEVTRRAAHGASGTDYRIENSMDAIRWNAVFNTAPGELVFGKPVTDSHIRIDYLGLQRASDGTLSLTPPLVKDVDLPRCPSRNYFNCAHDQNSTNGPLSCIRFVRVRICEPANTSTCDPVKYVPLVPFIPLSLTLPISTTIVKAGTLGYVPGATLCPP